MYIMLYEIATIYVFTTKIDQPTWKTNKQKQGKKKRKEEGVGAWSEVPQHFDASGEDWRVTGRHWPTGKSEKIISWYIDLQPVQLNSYPTGSMCDRRKFRSLTSDNM